MNVTKEQFNAYVKVQKSGLTNMFDVNQVILLSDYELDKDVIIEIMSNYDELSKKYKVDDEDEQEFDEYDFEYYDDDDDDE